MTDEFERSLKTESKHYKALSRTFKSISNMFNLIKHKKERYPSETQISQNFQKLKKKTLKDKQKIPNNLNKFVKPKKKSKKYTKKRVFLFFFCRNDFLISKLKQRCMKVYEYYVNKIIHTHKKEELKLFNLKNHINTTENEFLINNNSTININIEDLKLRYNIDSFESVYGLKGYRKSDIYDVYKYDTPSYLKRQLKIITKEMNRIDYLSKKLNLRFVYNVDRNDYMVVERNNKSLGKCDGFVFDSFVGTEFREVFKLPDDVLVPVEFEKIEYYHTKEKKYEEKFRNNEIKENEVKEKYRYNEVKEDDNEIEECDNEIEEDSEVNENKKLENIKSQPEEEDENEKNGKIKENKSNRINDKKLENDLLKFIPTDVPLKYKGRGRKVYLCDEDGKFIKVNEGNKNIYNFSKTEYGNIKEKNSLNEIKNLHDNKNKIFYENRSKKSYENNIESLLNDDIKNSSDNIRNLDDFNIKNSYENNIKSSFDEYLHFDSDDNKNNEYTTLTENINTNDMYKVIEKKNNQDNIFKDTYYKNGEFDTQDLEITNSNSELKNNDNDMLKNIDYRKYTSFTQGSFDENAFDDYLENETFVSDSSDITFIKETKRK